jgi:serine/threonine-protein kinase RsbW
MVEIPNVRLSLSNSAENVLLVRRVLSALAEIVSVDAVELNDINTAVSEACNNVVLHAYGGEEGPMEVDICSRPRGLSILVRDHGRGIPGFSDALAEQAAGGGIGLPVIRALAKEVEFRDLSGGGTAVRMEFATARAVGLQQPPQADGLITRAIPARDISNTAAIAIAPSTLARTIVPCVVSALAARAYFSTDRISDAELLADTLVAHTDDSLSASHLNVTITTMPRRLQLRLGPLHRGHADTLINDSAIEGLGPMLNRLSDGHEVTPSGASEILALHLAER